MVNISTWPRRIKGKLFLSMFGCILMSLEMADEVEVVETLPLEKGNYTVFLGFAGFGMVGSTAAMYIVRSRGLLERGYVRSRLIAPMMILIDGRPRPPFRIYGGDEGLLFIVSEAFLTTEGSWPIGFRLMEWLSNKGVKEIISMDGVLSGARERVIMGFSTGDLSRLDVRPTQEGIISGISACLLDEALKRGIPWTSLFVPTQYMSSVDYGAVADVIEVLNGVFDLKVDVSPLRRRDEEIRKMAERLARETRERGRLPSLFRLGRPDSQGRAGGA
jgi:predicted ATP-grasp superfamily ATP-dependent carboligase